MIWFFLILAIILLCVSTFNSDSFGCYAHNYPLHQSKSHSKSHLDSVLTQTKALAHYQYTNRIRKRYETSPSIYPAFSSNILHTPPNKGLPLMRIHYGSKDNTFTKLDYDRGFDVPSSKQRIAIKAKQDRKYYPYSSFMKMALEKSPSFFVQKI